MKVLITGATGFIGNYVVKELLKLEKFKIITTALDPVENAQELEWFDDVKYIIQDLNEEKENYFSYFENPELLIHLAWQGLPNYKELFHIERNLCTNYKFLKNMIKNGLNNLSIIGTCAEYGMQSGHLSEDMPTFPNTPYSLAKDTLRKFIEELNKKYEFNFKWIRLFYLYGKGQDPRSLIPQLQKALDNNDEIFNMSGGEQIRDYLPVEKVALYITKISIQNNINGIFNCCSGKPISIKELVKNYLKEHNKTIKLNFGYYPYPDYEPMEFWGDNRKLRKILNDFK